MGAAAAATAARRPAGYCLTCVEVVEYQLRPVISRVAAALQVPVVSTIVRPKRGHAGRVDRELIVSLVPRPTCSA